jgi:MerR family transcriptional regulator, light-induced transcriptional regulator
MKAGQGGLSIGALSAATGIPVETIRTWERRYGFPIAERKPSGHRVYPVSTVPRLRLIARALTQGHRAAEVVPASERALEALIAVPPMREISDARPPQAAVLLDLEDTNELFAAVRLFDSERLRRAFQHDWALLGPLEFAELRAGPFLKTIGDAWASGELDIRHEHFASACLGDFLRTVRIPLDDRARGPTVALATLTGEQHGLGLQLCALVFALAGWRTIVLGVDTPVDQIIALTKETAIAAVALSYVLPRETNALEEVRALRRRLPRGVALILGGGAAPRIEGKGIDVLSDLRSVDRWVRER